MTGPTHELIGLTGGVAAGQALGLPLVPAVALAFCSIAASSLPDIFELGVLPHRRATHCLLAVAAWCGLCIIGMLAGGIAMAANLGLALGYMLHLLADMCTPHGVPLAWPVSERCVHVLPRALRMRTGSGRESLFAGVTAVLVVAMVMRGTML